MEYDNDESGLSADNVQDAIDEIAVSGIITVEDDDGGVSVAPTVVVQFEADQFTVSDEGSGVAKVTFSGSAGGGVMPLTAVIDDIPMLVWDENNSLIPVDS